MTYSEVLQYFLQHLEVERNLSKNTIAAYNSDLKKFGEFLVLNNYKLGTIDGEKITRYTLFLKKKELSPLSIIRALSSIRGCYKNMAAGIVKGSDVPVWNP